MAKPLIGFLALVAVCGSMTDSTASAKPAPPLQHVQKWLSKTAAAADPSGITWTVVGRFRTLDDDNELMTVFDRYLAYSEEPNIPYDVAVLPKTCWSRIDAEYSSACRSRPKDWKVRLAAPAAFGTTCEIESQPVV